MEANKEYRIGNYVLDYETEPNYFQIDEIKKNEQGNLAVYYRNSSVMDTDPEPIPITEDILLKCEGVKKIGKYFYLYEKSIRVSLSSLQGVYWLELGYDKESGTEWNLIKDFSEVHKLQNICYDLTDEELNINL